MDIFSIRFTPVDNSDPSCDRTWLSFCIYNIDPDLVTKKLNISPTGGFKKGHPRIMPSGKKRIGLINSWVLSSRNLVTSKDIRTHLDWLLDKIEPSVSQIKEIQEIPDVKMVIRCVWWSAEGGGGPTLWPEQMKRMADLNLECNFSFAYYGEEPEIPTNE